MAIRLRDIDPAVFLNNVAIGTTSASSHTGYRTLTLAGDDTYGCLMDFFKGATRMGSVYTNGITDFRVGSIANVPFQLITNAQARMTISAAGNIGTPYAFHVTNGGSASAGNAFYSPAPNEMGISTNGVERIRIGTQGNIGMGLDHSSVWRLSLENLNSLIRLSMTSSSSAQESCVAFRKNGSAVGYVNCSTSSTHYGTSSDYRLKENESLITDGTSRLKLLRPLRFNFKKDPENFVDGFFAHEVSPVVAEAVGGEKDAVDEEGEIKPQGLDYAKLVPLLTAALQETVARVESLEAKIEQLEN